MTFTVSVLFLKDQEQKLDLALKSALRSALTAGSLRNSVMVDFHEPRQNQRDFTLISFSIRLGQVYRRDKLELRLSVTDSCAGIMARESSARVAQGQQVLVFEHGSIKPDWSRLDRKGFHALRTMPRADFDRLFRDVVNMTFADSGEFYGHLERSFPGLK